MITTDSEFSYVSNPLSLLFWRKQIAKQLGYRKTDENRLEMRSHTLDVWAPSALVPIQPQNLCRAQHC